jgi:threonine synthase
MTTTHPIRYYSTNRAVPEVSLGEALLQGQAADRGLFMPREYLSFTRAELAELRTRTYPEIAYEVLRRFTAGTIDDADLMRLCKDAYDYEVPLEKVRGRRHLMRLDRGPTASFKDFAARMMARWMSLLLAADKKQLTILTATSGDTGSAVAHAYHGLSNINILVLFPIAEVSNRQRKQMTTLGGNVATFGVNGKFDDCQAMVKRAFADPALSSIRLSSANSINIGRLLPQAVYYIYAYVKLADVEAGESILTCVPSGNFGDMMGAVIARRMGVPMSRLVIATNANDEVPIFLRRGTYEKIVPSRVCISNAMNVGHPSNLARLVDAYGGWMDETGLLREVPDLEKLRNDVWAVSITDEETRQTIREAFEQDSVVLEPHGAVGWAGLLRYLAEEVKGPEPLSVSVETAHPAKFPEEIKRLLGVDPEPPPSLKGLDHLTERWHQLTTDYEPFRDLLLKSYAPR